MRYLNSIPLALGLSVLAALGGGVALTSAEDLTPQAATERPTLELKQAAREKRAYIGDEVIRDAIRSLNAPDIVALAREMAELADSLEAVLDTYDPVADGLGFGADSLFPDPSTLPGTGGGEDHGLPDDAPPSGWVFGGIASQMSLPTFADLTHGEPGVRIPRSPTAAGETNIVTPLGGGYLLGTTTWQDRGDEHATTTLWHGGQIVWMKYNKNGTTRIIFRGPAWSARQGGVVSDGKPGGAVDKPVAEGSSDKQTKPGDKQTNPGDDGLTQTEQAWADWLWRQHQSGRTPAAGAKSPDRVNPEDPESPGNAPMGPSIWDTLDKDALVTNPDPTTGRLADHAPSALAWAIMHEVLQAYSQGVTPGARPIGRGAAVDVKGAAATGT